MRQALSIFARIWLVALLGCLCASALAGWASTGHVDSASAWVLWLLGSLWANPTARTLTLAAVTLESWNRLAMRGVWS
jgi:hypothetical protein